MGWSSNKNNKTRGACFGIPFVVIMGGLIYFSMVGSAVSGCAGDCMTCHPKLVGDEDHLSLTTCIRCHDSAATKYSALKSNNTGCGDRCFQCHIEWPKDGYHAPLLTCLNCHNK